MKNLLKICGISFIILLFWELAARKVNMYYLIPPPTEILKKIWGLRENLFLVHLPSTLKIVYSGLLISVLIGLILAILMSEWKYAKQFFYPMIVFSQTIPIIAVAPLFILWFGYGFTSQLAVTILMTFFPIAITIYEGLQTTQTAYKELLTTFGASRWQLYRFLYFPSITSYLVASVKLAVPIAFIAATIGEYLGASAGLGYFSKRMMTQLDGPGVFAPIVLLSIITYLHVWLFQTIEKKKIHWRHTQ